MITNPVRHLFSIHENALQQGWSLAGKGDHPPKEPFWWMARVKGRFVHEKAHFGGWRGKMAFGGRMVWQVLKVGICDCPVILLPLFYARFARRIVSHTAVYEYPSPDRNCSGCDDDFVRLRAGTAACAGLPHAYPYTASSGGTPHQWSEGVRGSSGGRFPLSYSCHG